MHWLHQRSRNAPVPWGAVPLTACLAARLSLFPLKLRSYGTSGGRAAPDIINWEPLAFAAPVQAAQALAAPSRPASSGAP